MDHDEGSILTVLFDRFHHFVIRWIDKFNIGIAHVNDLLAFLLLFLCISLDFQCIFARSTQPEHLIQIFVIPFLGS